MPVTLEVYKITHKKYTVGITCFSTSLCVNLKIWWTFRGRVSQINSHTYYISHLEMWSVIPLSPITTVVKGKLSITANGGGGGGLWQLTEISEVTEIFIRGAKFPMEYLGAMHPLIKDFNTGLPIQQRRKHQKMQFFSQRPKLCTPLMVRKNEQLMCFTKKIWGQTKPFCILAKNGFLD